tara:strand:+ start:418 stop:750 length:333 start_codon:yes stop_codon:yes gene_type:complete
MMPKTEIIKKSAYTALLTFAFYMVIEFVFTQRDERIPIESIQLVSQDRYEEQNKEVSTREQNDGQKFLVISNKFDVRGNIREGLILSLAVFVTSMGIKSKNTEPAAGGNG